MVFFGIYNSISKLLNKYLDTNYSVYKISALSIIVSLFFAFPSYHVLLKGEFDYHYELLKKQSDNPLISLKSNDDTSHASKLAFRFVPAVLAKFFCGSKLGYSVIIFSSWIFFMVAFASLLRKILDNNNLSTTYIMLIISVLPLGGMLCSDYRGIFDSMAFLFILLAMLFNKFILLQLAFFLLAFFTDERALISSGFLIVFYLIKNKQALIGSLMNRDVITISISWLFYFIIRYLLSINYGLKTGEGGLNYFIGQINNIPLSLLFLFKGFWIIIFYSFYELKRLKKFIVFSFFILAMLLTIYVSHSVIDITRSACYSFPAILISVLILKDKLQDKLYQPYLIYIFLISLFPTYFIEAKNTANWAYPFPMQLIYVIIDSIS